VEGARIRRDIAVTETPATGAGVGLRGRRPGRTLPLLRPVGPEPPLRTCLSKAHNSIVRMREWDTVSSRWIARDLPLRAGPSHSPSTLTKVPAGS